MGRADLLTNSVIEKELRRLSKLPGWPGENDADSRDYRREMGLALRSAETAKQAHDAITALLHERGRRWCPTPGEIESAAEDQRPILPLAQRKPEVPAPPPPPRVYNCPRCEDTGGLDVREQGRLDRLAWCDCEAATARRSREPGWVDEFNARMDRAEAGEGAMQIRGTGVRRAVEKLLADMTSAYDRRA